MENLNILKNNINNLLELKTDSIEKIENACGEVAKFLYDSQEYYINLFQYFFVSENNKGITIDIIEKLLLLIEQNKSLFSYKYESSDKLYSFNFNNKEIKANGYFLDHLLDFFIQILLSFGVLDNFLGFTDEKYNKVINNFIEKNKDLLLVIQKDKRNHLDIKVKIESIYNFITKNNLELKSLIKLDNSIIKKLEYGSINIFYMLLSNDKEIIRNIFTEDVRVLQVFKSNTLNKIIINLVISRLLEYKDIFVLFVNNNLENFNKDTKLKLYSKDFLFINSIIFSPLAEEEKEELLKDVEYIEKTYNDVLLESILIEEDEKHLALNLYNKGIFVNTNNIQFNNKDIIELKKEYKNIFIEKTNYNINNLSNVEIIDYLLYEINNKDINIKNKLSNTIFNRIENEITEEFFINNNIRESVEKYNLCLEILTQYENEEFLIRIYKIIYKLYKDSPDIILKNISVENIIKLIEYNEAEKDYKTERQLLLYLKKKEYKGFIEFYITNLLKENNYQNGKYIFDYKDVISDLYYEGKNDIEIIEEILSLNIIKKTNTFYLGTFFLFLIEGQTNKIDMLIVLDKILSIKKDLLLVYEDKNGIEQTFDIIINKFLRETNILKVNIDNIQESLGEIFKLKKGNNILDKLKNIFVKQDHSLLLKEIKLYQDKAKKINDNNVVLIKNNIDNIDKLIFFYKKYSDISQGLEFEISKLNNIKNQLVLVLNNTF